jgi:hypothetical protein
MPKATKHTDPARKAQMRYRRSVQRARTGTHLNPPAYKSIHSRFYKEFYGYGKAFRRREEANALAR